MENENLTPEALPEVSTTTDGETGTVDTSTPESLTLEELNEHLGKKFKTKEGALKALKDTFSYVGTAKKDSTPNSEVQELKTQMFFLQNPDYANELRPVLEAISKANNISLEEAAKTEVFTTTAERFKGAQPQKNTVMPSSSRMAVPETAKRIQDARGNVSELAKIVNERFKQ
jgi:hypothetical protein